MAEFASAGIWTPGLAPTFATLTDGATVTQTCSKYHSIQTAKVVLGGNRTLAISGALSGMRGVIYVKQDGTGSRTLTLPNGSCTPASWALSTAAYTIDRLSWEYDGSFFYWGMLKGLTEPIDADAQVFLTATSITDDTIETAINNLVLGLKGASLWTRFKAIYPFVGGTSAKHAVDLKAFSNITDNAAWQAATHNANGITGNGTSAFGSLGFGPDDVGTVDSLAMSIYCRTAQPTLNGMLVGTQTNGSFRSYIRRTKPSSTDFVSCAINVSGEQIIAASEDDFTGFICASRTASTSSFLRENGTNATNSTASSGATTQNFYALALNASSVATNFTNANLALLGISDGLTTAEAATVEGLVNAFQSALSRS